MAGVTFLHCPFCGGQAVLKEIKLAIGVHYDIECAKCPAEMNGFLTKEKALEVWNKRTEPTIKVEASWKMFEEEMKKFDVVLHTEIEEEITWEA